MRNDDQRPFVAAEEVLEPVDGVEVQVVGRLVEQQRRGISKQCLREEHAHLLPALQLAHRPLVQRVEDIKTLQQHSGVAFGRVAVLLADDPLELAEAHPVLVGHICLGVEGIALRQRAPEAMVPHHNRIDDPVLVEGKLVLAQDSELGRPHDRPALRVDLAGQQLHERRFSRAIRPGEAVAAPRRELRGDVVEEHLGPEPHGHAAD